MNAPSPEHRQIWDLIPWVVNGSAGAAEHAQVERHLAECGDCRDELAFQQRVHAGLLVESPLPAIDAQAGLQRLFARMQQEETIAAPDQTQRQHGALLSAPAAARAHGSFWSRRRGRLLGAALVAQAALLLVLATLVLHQDRTALAPNTFETLSSAAPVQSAATIRFVPAPTMTVGALQTMLADARLRIVETSQGSAIYGLAPDGEPPAMSAGSRAAANNAAIQLLRSRPGVLLVEPILGAGAR